MPKFYVFLVNFLEIHCLLCFQLGWYVFAWIFHWFPHVCFVDAGKWCMQFSLDFKCLIGTVVMCISMIFIDLPIGLHWFWEVVRNDVKWFIRCSVLVLCVVDVWSWLLLQLFFTISNEISVWLGYGIWHDCHCFFIHSTLYRWACGVRS